jgi:phosphoglycerate dehydrogenase-like enzyme
MNTPSLLHVHLLSDYTDAAVNGLRAQLSPGVNLTSGQDSRDLSSCHILVGGRPTAEQLLACKNLQHLVSPWAGLPSQTAVLLRDFPHVRVHNLHHNASAVAELALALLLAAAKYIIPFDQALRNDNWSPRYAEPRDVILLEGKTTLILGYGAIGRRVARMCRGMDMEVLATKQHGPFTEDDVANEIHAADDLHDILPRANVLIVALPQTPQTTDLIGAAELSLMPVGSILVNIGRGPVVNEQALYDGLTNGRLAAAGLDVWYQYPEDEESETHTPPASLPFGQLENVVLSPHRAGLTADTEKLRMASLAKLINTAATGQPMPNEINLQKGY